MTAKQRNSRAFLDTNVLVYTDDPRDPVKQAKALDLIKQHLLSRKGVVSLQVLQEYFVLATGKLKLDSALAKERIEVFARLQVVEPTVTDILAAIDLHRLRGLSFWDALVVHSARQAGCSVLLTEDLQHGQEFDGVKIVNPFLN